MLNKRTNFIRREKIGWNWVRERKKENDTEVKSGIFYFSFFDHLIAIWLFFFFYFDAVLSLSFDWCYFIWKSIPFNVLFISLKLILEFDSFYWYIRMTTQRYYKYDMMIKNVLGKCSSLIMDVYFGINIFNHQMKRINRLRQCCLS